MKALRNSIMNGQGEAHMNVDQIMTRNVKVCHPQDLLNEAARIMWEQPCGAVPVVDEQSRPIGFLTDRDICMAAYTQGKPLDALRVETAMARNVVSCKAEDDLRSAAKQMRDHRIRRLPVIDRDGTLVGLLSLDDLACETAHTLLGDVNERILRGRTEEELRFLVLEVHLAIHHGRAGVQPPG
jgi:CBS domain-containing protein